MVRASLLTPIEGAARLRFGEVLASLSIQESFDIDGRLTRLDLDWNDGSPLETLPLTIADDLGRLYSHRYTAAGDYIITVTLYDNATPPATQSVSLPLRIEANLPPELCFSTNALAHDELLQISTQLPLHLEALCSTDAESDLLKIGRVTVDYGDGIILENYPLAALGTQSHIYSEADTYSLTFTVHDGEGQSVSQTMPVHVIGNFPPEICGTTSRPIIDGRIEVVAGNPLQFDWSCASDRDSDLIASGRLHMDFGNGTVLNWVRLLDHKLVTRKFNTPGTYHVVCRVRDTHLDHSTPLTYIVDVVETPSNLKPVPVIQADVTSGKRPLKVTFDASGSYDPDGRITSYVWQFGDVALPPPGGGSAEPEVSYTYSVPEVQYATLTVIDDSQHGPPFDRDSTSVAITVLP